jgi:hypothetical protein
MESVSQGLWKEKWGGVPSYKRAQSCQLIKHLGTALTCFVWKMARTPLLVVDKDNHLSKQTFISVLQMKRSSTCLITASLCEGPIFYFYVESTYSPLSQASIWVVLFQSSICWFIQSCFLSSFVLYDAFIWKNTSLKAIYDCKETILVEHVVFAILDLL